ncbi:hypothetical protein KCP75_16030 [Salmonella enterica subsp. enterica]|nr:hypothetical protein KCP75_16030 [Salmonella enterica subsp. enterica]
MRRPVPWRSTKARFRWLTSVSWAMVPETCSESRDCSYPQFALAALTLTGPTRA